MLRLLSKLWFPLIACCLFVSTANAYNMVQSISASTGNNANPVTFSNPNAAGNTIIVSVGWLNGGTATVSDSNNNTYTSVLTTTNGFSSAIWYASNIAAGANTVTVTFNQWDNSTISVFEYSGLAASPLDTAVGNTGNSNSLDSGTVTTTQAGDLLFATGYGNSGGTLTAGSGYSMQQYSTWQGTHLGIETQSATSPSPYSASFADSNAWTWVAQIAAFRGAGASGGPTCGISNDATPHVPADWQTFAPPAKGQSYVDSTFGCTVTRITDVSQQIWESSCNGGGCYLPIGHGYSTVSPFNADDSLLLLGDGWGRRFISDLTGNIVVAESNMPSQFNDGWFYWDAANPSVFYYTYGNYLMSGTVSGSSVTTATVHQFTEYAAINFMDETDVSQDGQHVVLIAGDNSGTSPENVFDYNFVTNTKGPVYTTGCTGIVNTVNNGCLHKLIQTPDNNVTIDFANDGTGPEQGVRLWTGSTPLPHLQDGTNHMDTGYDMNGNAVFIEVGDAGTPSNPCPSHWGLDVRQIYNTASAVCLLDNQPSWHVGYRGNAQQPWVVLSFEDQGTIPDPEWFQTSPNYTAPNSGNWSLYKDEIAVVRVDANNNSNLVYRLARAYSRTDEDFDAQVKASMSRDGKYIAFDSNAAYAHTGCPSNFQTPTNCSDVYVIKTK